MGKLAFVGNRNTISGLTNWNVAKVFTQGKVKYTHTHIHTLEGSNVPQKAMLTAWGFLLRAKKNRRVISWGWYVGGFFVLF